MNHYITNHCQALLDQDVAGEVVRKAMLDDDNFEFYFKCKPWYRNYIMLLQDDQVYLNYE